MKPYADFRIIDGQPVVEEYDSSDAWVVAGDNNLVAVRRRGGPWETYTPEALLYTCHGPLTHAVRMALIAAGVTEGLPD